MQLPLHPVSFETATGIRHELHLAASPERSSDPNILVIKFSGSYRAGSRGTPDARFMMAITRAALMVWSPKALALDLRELAYVWGDDMEDVLGVRGEFKMPHAVVGSDSCLPAICTLIKPFYPSGKIRVATDAEQIFDDLEVALAYLHKKT